MEKSNFSQSPAERRYKYGQIRQSYPRNIAYRYRDINYPFIHKYLNLTIIPYLRLPIGNTTAEDITNRYAAAFNGSNLGPGPDVLEQVYGRVSYSNACPAT